MNKARKTDKDFDKIICRNLQKLLLSAEVIYLIEEECGFLCDQN